MRLSVLNELYPFNDSSKRALKSSLVFGLFIFLFLQIFQPFGLSNYNVPNKTYYLLGYGLITSFCLIINHLLFKYLLPNWYQKESWTIKKNILYTIWIFIFIGSGNLLYSVYLNILSLSIKGFLAYQGITLVIGLIPVTISTFFIYNKKLRESLSRAKELNSSMHQIKPSEGEILIPSRNKSETFSVDTNSLLSIKSVENYVEVYWLKNNEIQKTIIRNALMEIEKKLIGHPEFIRCHRSHLVNLSLVDSFTGNAQGLILQFINYPDFFVPVSRSFAKELKPLIELKS